MSDINSKQAKNRRVTFIKIIRWVIFGVIASILPFAFMLSRYWLSDLSTVELDYLLDLLLIVFAISANAVGLIWDDEKKISIVIKTASIAILVIVMFYCGSTYASLFEQTILNNKLLDEYDSLVESLETVSTYLDENPEYEDTMQRLSGIKYIIEETGPKPDRLKQLKDFSIISIMATLALGIMIEYLEGRKRQKEISTPSAADGDTPLTNDDQKYLDQKDGE